MSEPYTAQTLDRIRLHASLGWPPGITAWVIGWDVERLERVAHHHQIKFVATKKEEQRATPTGLKWDGKHAWSAGRSVRLPPAQGRIFAVIARRPGYGWTHMLLAERSQIPRRSMAPNLSLLRRNLRSIGLVLTKRPYRLERA